MKPTVNGILLYIKNEIFILDKLTLFIRLITLLIIAILLLETAGNLSHTAQLDLSAEANSNDYATLTSNPGNKPPDNLKEYASVLNHQLFWEKESTPKSKPKQAPDRSLETLLANYDIQGVIWGDRPKAIIYDKLKKETLTAGIQDSLGQIKIVEITPTSIKFQLLGDIHEINY